MPERKFIMDDSIFDLLGQIMIFLIIWMILLIVASWKIYKKAGKPGWHAIIPFLSTYDLFEFTWSSTMGYVAIALTIAESLLSRYSVAAAAEDSSSAMTLIASMVSIVFAVITFIDYYKLSKSFGHGFGFFLGLVFLNPIFMLILAFGSSQYIGPNGVPVYGAYGAPMQGGYNDPNAYGQPYGGQSYGGGYETYGQNGAQYPPQYPPQQQGYQNPQQNPFENNNNNYGNYQ